MNFQIHSKSIKINSISQFLKTKNHIFLQNSLHTLHLNPQHLKFVVPNSPTHFNSLLNTTTQSKNIKHAEQIHSQLIVRKFLYPFHFLFNNLLNLYSKCNQFGRSLALFTSLDGTQFAETTKNVVTWTSMITQLSHNNSPFQALTFFNEMRRVNVNPNNFTFSAILPACSNSFVVFHGHQVHGLCVKHGFHLDVYVGSALLDMYAKCCDMMSAKAVFDEMPDKNLVSWNSMIVGFLQNMCFHEAINYFIEVLREERLKPDQVSFSSLFCACGSLGDAVLGRQGHGASVKLGLVSLPYVNNSLMDMYGRCGLLCDANRLFGSSGVKDVVTWNVLIIGCVQNENFEDACKYFWVMRREGVSPDEASFSSALHAASCIAALQQGTLIHEQIIKTGFSRNTCISSSLITMYSKCGSLEDALRAFRESEERNVVSWTSIISACQQHGYTSQVIGLFEDMLHEGIRPDYITFVSVLSACGHTGLIDQGFSYFNSMSERHGMNPGPEHYACIVDLLGRAGRLQEAKRFVDAMPIAPDASVCGALLGACLKYGDINMGRDVAQKLFKIEPHNSGNYVLLCNLYSHGRKLEEADEVRRLMGTNRVKKEPGCSWIDVKNITYIFTAHDRSHLRTSEIYKMLEMLEVLVQKKGYMDATQCAVNDVDG